MAMGTRRRRQRQERLWISHQELAKGPGHPFYKRVNELLETERFDEFAEKECARFYAENNGRPSLTPGSISGCCWSDILKESILSVGLLGERRIPLDCDSSWGSR